jgi:hypothetical protein
MEKRKRSLHPSLLENVHSKLVKRNQELREWSVGDGLAKNYTFKCFYGDPEKRLPSWLKTSCVERNAGEEENFEQRNKPVLLERLQKDMPWVRVEIDGRECIQRLVNALVYSIGCIYSKWKCQEEEHFNRVLSPSETFL